MFDTQHRTDFPEATAASGDRSVFASWSATPMLIEVLKWDKYNPRSDVKSTRWLRLQNDILIELYELTNDQKLVWIALLCEASRKQTGKIDISPGLIAALLKVTEDVVVQSVEAFAKLGFVALLPPARHAHVTRTSRKRPVDVALRNGTGRDVTGRDVVRPETPDGVSSSSTPAGRRRPAAPSPRDLASLWNEASAATMSKVDLEDFDSKNPRWKAAAARLAAKPDLAYWRTVIERLNQSPFWRGEVEPTGDRKRFVGNFASLVRAETHLKALEGFYDPRTGGDGTFAHIDWGEVFKERDTAGRTPQ